MTRLKTKSPDTSGHPRGACRGRGKRGLCLALGALLGMSSGCAYEGGIDQPVTIKATWFSYLNGDDIRAACVDGAPSWYRLVYNGNYDEQLRSYEIIDDGTGAAYYKARVMRGGGLNLDRFSLFNPQSLAGWTTAQAFLAPPDYASVNRALESSGAFGPTPSGLRLASEQFYWIASLCRNGQFYFNAWLHPSARFTALKFPEILLRFDTTGLAINPPRRVPRGERVRRITPGDGTPAHFDVVVGDTGLQGHRTLF